MESGGTVTIAPARRVRGRVVPPGDKSISHRYAIVGALATGTTRIANYAPGADCASTLRCLRDLGVAIGSDADRRVVVAGRGLGGLQPSARPLDAGNSGTTLRLLAGALAAHPFATTLTGDSSLRTRPMRRIVVPLELMGARVDTTGGCAPITVHGTRLHEIDYAPDVASAQVKSAVLLAGLHVAGKTAVDEIASTRDHTELALAAFGARLERHDRRVVVEGGHTLQSRDVTVPGDVSSAAFWAVAAAALPGSEIEIADVGLNPTRTAIFEALGRVGADVSLIVERTEAGEPVGRVTVRHRRLVPLVVTGADVPGLIDELPALAALASCGAGLDVSGAAELRTKESDRISALAEGLRALGADVTERPDGFVVGPARRLAGGRANARGDHRLAMAFAVAALAASGPSTIDGADAVAVSYPGFFDVLESLRD